MEFKLKPIGKVQKNCFLVDIEYNNANGCTDFKTHASYILNTKEMPNLEKYIATFNIISLAINKLKDDCEPLDSNVEKLIKNKMINHSYINYISVNETTLYVTVKQDLTDDGEGEYTSYAGMKIKKIIFIDNEREQFEVTW